MSGAQLRVRTIHRSIALVVLLAMLVGVIAVRLVNVQVVSSERYLAYGDSQRDASRPIPASRGSIYDRNGQALALSVAQPRAVVDPAQVEHPERTAAALASIVDVPRSELDAKVTADSRYKVLAADLTDAQVAKIREGVRAGDIEGVTIEDEFVRSNPNDDLALGVIGRSLADGQTDEDGRSGGISGVEAAYDGELAGKPGKLYFEQDVDGDPIAGGHRALEPAKQGADLYLTLDETLQYEAERSISDAVTSSGASAAQAVIMRPSTGEILAMASVAVDGDGEVHVTRDNKPVTSVFEPGSVNKMITIAGAIEDGVVSPDTYVNVPDHLQIYDADFHDSHPHPTADWTTTEILYTSSNIGTIKIARMLGAERVDAYLRSFGFGATTGLGFPAEEDGIMKDLDDWSGVDIGSMPIGQGISVTALQMLSAYNVIANDGIYVAPKLVSSVDRGSGPVPTEPSAGRRVVSADTAGKVRAMLAKVVSEGTGTKAQVPGYVPAGKTGTARAAQGGDGEDGYLDENGNYRYDASFVGMIDGADLSILVTVHDPKTSIFGGDIAAPVFSHLAATALRRYQIPPPELLDAAAHDVPEVSASAREVDGEDVSAGAASGQG
ncbi:MAG: penicillin-binding protein 2 [Acidimicrobiales bacterium]|nr:penicillin-binding protein 2 [Acidimicrobiales bacterium]